MPLGGERLILNDMTRAQPALIITNGDSGVAALREAGLRAPCLAWADVLHEGPVLPLPLGRLSRLRAEFLAQQGWGALPEILESFRRRNALLESVTTRQEVLLWFEHDVYDQLQLIQLLAWFHDQPGRRRPSLTLVCTDQFVAFCKPDVLRTSFRRRLEVQSKQLELGKAAWEAFCSPRPAALVRLSRSPQDQLPFLSPALRRLLQEYPADNGTSRTQAQILNALDAGPKAPSDLFRANQRQEKAVYLGDLVFWHYLEQLSRGPSPLLSHSGGSSFRAPPAGERVGNEVLELTHWGRKALAGEVDWVKLNGIDRWIGGVHLTSKYCPRRSQLLDAGDP